MFYFHQDSKYADRTRDFHVPPHLLINIYINNMLMIEHGLHLPRLLRAANFSKTINIIQMSLGPEGSLLALSLPVISSLWYLWGIWSPVWKRTITSTITRAQQNASSPGSGQPGNEGDSPEGEQPAKNEPAFEPIGDHEWNSYSEHTRRVALLTWSTREKIPAGFLSKPDYAKEFTYVEEILARQATLDGSTQVTEKGNIFLRGILVNQENARKSDYTVEDPLNPGTALYLDAEGYRKLSNSCISNRKTVNVLFHPLSDKTKFPPTRTLDVSNKWIRTHKCAHPPFLLEDPGSWMNFIHPSICPRNRLEKAIPASSSANPLGPCTRPDKAAGYINRCMSNLVAILELHSIPINIQWGVVSIVLTFLHMWYYTSLRHSATFYKEAKRLLMKYLAGTPEKMASGKLVMSLDKSGLPKIIPTFLRMKIRTGNIVAIAATFFALDVPRMFVYIGADKLSTITENPEISSDLVSTLAEAFPLVFDAMPDPVIQRKLYGGRFIADKDQGLLSVLGQCRLFYTNKAGPNGHALLAAGLDAISMVSNPQLWSLFTSYCVLVRNELLPQYVERFAGLTTRVIEFITLMSREPRAKLTHQIGKIGRVYTAFGKCRLIAIPAYFIQVAFKPIHDLVFRYLPLLETDCTFNQSAGVDRIAKIGGDNLKSYDLSAATDRLPLVIQVPILALLAFFSGQSSAWKVAQTWADLIRAIPFKISFSKSKKHRTLHYGCGHPMGTYSSWAVFSFTHHLLVQVCALWALLDYNTVSDALVANKNSGGRAMDVIVNDDNYYSTSKDKRKSLSKSLLSESTRSSFKGGWYIAYQLLGDDIVLFGRTDFESRVSVLYMELMNLIGVKINPAKGVESRNGSFEFCKRFVRKDKHLNNIYWAEWTLSFSALDFVSKVALLLARGYKLVNIKTLVLCAINLLPITIAQKRQYLKAYSDFKVITTYPSEYAYLAVLNLGALLHLYQIRLTRWVSISMGEDEIPVDITEHERGVYSEHVRKNIEHVLKYASLILQDISSKTFVFRLRLPILLLKSIITTVMTNHEEELGVPYGTRRRFLSQCMEVLSNWSLGLAYILQHPAFVLMRSYSVFSFKSILFAEVETLSKYQKSVSFEETPWAPIDELVNKDNVDSKEGGVTDSSSSQLKQYRVFGSILFGYWRFLAWFSGPVEGWETLLDDIELLESNTWIREVGNLAAARLLIWYDQITDQRKIDVSDCLPSDKATPVDYFGSATLKFQYSESPSKGRRGTRLPKPEVYNIVGQWAIMLQCVDRPPAVDLFYRLDYKAIEEFVVLLNIEDEGRVPAIYYV